MYIYIYILVVVFRITNKIYSSADYVYIKKIIYIYYIIEEKNKNNRKIEIGHGNY